MTIGEEIKAIPVRYNRGEFGREVHYAHYSEGFTDALEEAAKVVEKHEKRIKELERYVATLEKYV